MLIYRLQADSVILFTLVRIQNCLGDSHNELPLRRVSFYQRRRTKLK